MHLFHKAIDVVQANVLDKATVSLLREVDKFFRDRFSRDKLVFNKNTASAAFTAYCYDHPNGFCGSQKLAEPNSNSEIFTYVVTRGNVQLLKQMMHDGKVSAPRYVIVNGARFHACSLALLSSVFPVTKMAILIEFINLHINDCFEIFYFLVQNYVTNARTCSCELSIQNIRLFMLQTCQARGQKGFQFTNTDLLLLAKTLFKSANVDYCFMKQICLWVNSETFKLLMCLYNQERLIHDIGLESFSPRELLNIFVSGNLKLYESSRRHHDKDTFNISNTVITETVVNGILNGCSWNILKLFLNDWCKTFWRWDLSNFCCREIFEIMMATAAYAGSLDILTNLPRAITITVPAWDLSNIFFAVKGNQANLFTHIVEKELDVVEFTSEPFFLPTAQQTKMISKVFKSTHNFRAFIYNCLAKGYFVDNDMSPEQTVVSEPLVLCFVLAVYESAEEIIDVYCKNDRCRAIVTELMNRYPAFLQTIWIYITNDDLLHKIASTFNGASTLNPILINANANTYIEALRAFNYEVASTITLDESIVKTIHFVNALILVCKFIKCHIESYLETRYSKLREPGVFPWSFGHTLFYDGNVLFYKCVKPEHSLHRAIICLRLVEKTNPYFMKTRLWKTFLSTLPAIINFEEL